MNNPFEYVPSAECEAAFGRLVARLEVLKKSEDPADVNFCRELEAGKMLGVLVAADRQGVHHTLYAFSGQIGERGFYHDGFVGPVFDYLQPDGHFKTHEADISRQNAEIAAFENDSLARVRSEYERVKALADAEIAESREKYRLSKLERAAIREAGEADEAVLAEMIRRSQFEKAELHRLKKRLAARIEPYAEEHRKAEDHLAALKEKRRADSEALQQWLFTNFRLLNARGESRSLSEIFADTSMRVPPSGAGECCAPKLLQEAYLRGWEPLSIAEYWYGKPKEGEVRRHGEHYPACRGKCLPVLSWMLQGLSVEPALDSDSGQLRSVAASYPEVIFENRWFCVVNKPSGMLSVPGKGAAMSVQRWLEEKYGADREVKVAHRLDQDTSGLLAATFGELSFKVMQSLFARRNVQKTYVAELEGDFTILDKPGHGRIELPLAPDWLDRPRQRVDLDRGKEAVTDFRFTTVAGGRSRVIFHPRTGRTHQLRVHAASEQGLGMPIAGDRLYGKNGGYGSRRLLLHAHRLEFIFPIDRSPYTFESPVPF